MIPRTDIAAQYRIAESELLPTLVATLDGYEGQFAATQNIARQLLLHLRSAQQQDWLSAFMNEYKISNAEGIALLTLSEALLRVPDTATTNQLLRDKLSKGDWDAHRGNTDSWLINSATTGLSIAQSLLSDERGILHKLAARMGEPVVRNVALAATRLLADHFVLGETIDDAIARARREELICSFDMLGEAARTQADAERYFQAYSHAIERVGNTKTQNVEHAISVKLSALYPRYEPLQHRHAIPAIAERLGELAQLAAKYNLQLTVDAEESERLDMSLHIIEQVARLHSLREWNGLGLAIQAYQKRALPALKWVSALARDIRRPIKVRLVKGAYWDTEIKRCQQAGLSDYPVFTRKIFTDTSYLACAHFMLKDEYLHSAFATHNALSVAQLLNWRKQYNRSFEFQRLHGMGTELHAKVSDEYQVPCRIYAPVGGHRELLAYLVRRMLENGANSSFVQQVRRDELEMESLLADPVRASRDISFTSSPSISLPHHLFGHERINSGGLDYSDEPTREQVNTSLFVMQNGIRPSYETCSTTSDVVACVDNAYLAYRSWSQACVDERAQCLERAADEMQEQMTTLVSALTLEAKKTRMDAMNEVREAIDFCRYYALMARDLMQDRSLPGPTGESNTSSLTSRGVFACISPWNFPLAIFVGQVAAALACGNTVVAKPAPQTPFIASRIVTLLHEAGIPQDVLQLVTGGVDIGEALIAHPLIAGVAFTGSTLTARKIAQSLLVNLDRPLVPLIAETGGINAMIVDSTALPEQVVNDVIISAFHSAGQRCSALRLLCIQQELYEPVLNMLQGAMDTLRIGDTAEEDIDVGAVIDSASQRKINEYIDSNRRCIRHQSRLDAHLKGTYIAPTVIQLNDPTELQQEIFGPVLHVTSWKSGELDKLVDDINSTGYGLTMGVHTRLESTIDFVRKHARVGNLYVNRSMIGAVVGVQPFGGEGLSGTGFKAGGSHYLLRFCVERTVSIDTTAAGGNASLLSSSQ